MKALLLLLIVAGCHIDTPCLEYYACKDSAKGAMIIGLPIDSAARICGGPSEVITYNCN